MCNFEIGSMKKKAEKIILRNVNEDKGSLVVLLDLNIIYLLLIPLSSIQRTISIRSSIFINKENIILKILYSIQ